MFINIIKGVSVVFGLNSFFNQGDALKFLRTYCVDGKSIVFLGVQSTPGLSSMISILRAEGYEAVLRERVDRKTCTDLVTVGEFADATLIICDRDVDSLFGALKAIGLVYHEQDGGLAAFDGDATIIAGCGDEQMRLSRTAHLLVEAQAGLPSLPEYMADFSTYLWGRLFDCFIASVGQNADALRRLENFLSVEVLAAKAVEIAAGVWVVDARETPPPDFHGLIEAMGQLPNRVMTLVRQRGRSTRTDGAPELGLLRIDQDGKPADFQRFTADELSPELAAFLEGSPGLDVSDAFWNENVVPVFLRLFGPPTHV